VGHADATDQIREVVLATDIAAGAIESAGQKGQQEFRPESASAVPSVVDSSVSVGYPAVLRLFIVQRAPRRQGQDKFSLRSKP